MRKSNLSILQSDPQGILSWLLSKLHIVIPEVSFNGLSCIALIDVHRGRQDQLRVT